MKPVQRALIVFTAMFFTRLVLVGAGVAAVSRAGESVVAFVIAFFVPYFVFTAIEGSLRRRPRPPHGEARMTLASVALAVVLGLSLGQPARASDPHAPADAHGAARRRPTAAATARRTLPETMMHHVANG